MESNNIPSSWIELRRLKVSNLYARAKACLAPSDLALIAWVIGTCLPFLMSSVPNSTSIYSSFLICICFLALKAFRRYSAFLLMSLAACVAMLSISEHRANFFPTQYEGQSIAAKGRVIGLPQADKHRVRFDFEIQEIVSETEDLLGILGQKVRLSCYGCRQSILAGQRWQFTLRLKQPNGFASWGAFDYEKFLFRHAIVATGYVRDKEPMAFLSAGEEGIHSWRAGVRGKLLSAFPDATAGRGMLMALMLGDRSELSKQQSLTFQTVGVSHLMAISGLHIGLVFLVTALFARFLLWPVANIFVAIPRQQLVLLPALAAAFGYSAMAGFAISTQRAFVMLLIYVICRLLARDLSLLRVLLLAVVSLFLLDPFSVLDTGFWLSSYAVLLIAVISMRIENVKLWQLQPWLWLGMLPITALFFGKVSIISPVVNLIAVPIFCLVLIPITLLVLIMLMLGYDDSAMVIAAPLEVCFSVIYGVFEWLGNQPLSGAYPMLIEWWQLLILAVLVLISAYKWRYLVVLGLVGSTWLWPQPNKYDFGEHDITILDVGQGLAMVVETQDYVLVYDTGPRYRTGFSTAEAVLLPYLRSRGIRKIDHLIISHADNDHIGGLPIVLDQFVVNVISTSTPSEIPTSYRGTTRECRRGQSWSVSGVVFSLLGPDENTPEGSNNRSCVLSIGNGKLTTLITGDIEKRVERYMISSGERALLKADFMLVPHQGSKTSSTAEWIDLIDPQVAFVAAGYKNHYGHPHEQVVRRYTERQIKLHSTIDSGSMLLKIKGKDWRLVKFRQSEARFWRRQKLPN